MKKNGHASAKSSIDGPASTAAAPSKTTRKNGHSNGTTTVAAARSTATRKNAPVSSKWGNGNGPTSGTAADPHVLLYGLQSMRDGDFSVRLPGDWTGLEGKIADTFNEIVAANQKMAQELRRVGQVVGKEGKTRERMRFDQSKGAWGEMEVSVNTPHGGPAPANHRGDPRRYRCGAGESDANRAAGCGRASA